MVKLLVGDGQDVNVLCNIAPGVFIISADDGTIQKPIGTELCEYLAPMDESPVTCIYTAGGKTYMATTKQLFVFPSQQQLESVEARSIMQLTGGGRILQMLLLNDKSLILGFYNGQVQALDLESGVLTEVARFDDAICNLECYSDEVMLVNTMSGQMALLQAHDYKQLYTQVTNLTARGCNFFRHLPPSSALCCGFLVVCLSTQLASMLLDEPGVVQFSVDVPDCLAVKSMNNIVIAATRSSFIIYQLDGGFQCLSESNYDREECEVLSFIPYSNDNMLAIKYLYNDKNDGFKYLADITTKIPMELTTSAAVANTVQNDDLDNIYKLAVALTQQNDSSSQDLSMMENANPKVQFINDEDDDQQEESTMPDTRESLARIMEKIEQLRAGDRNVDAATQRPQPTRLANSTTSAKMVLRLNKHGQCKVAHTQNYILQYHFNNSDYQDKNMQIKTQVIGADIQVDSIAYITAEQLCVMSLKDSSNIWKATFSRVAKPIRVCLAGYNYCAVLFDNGQVIMYNLGLVVFQLCTSKFQTLCGYGSLFVVLFNGQLQLIDMETLKIAYQGPHCITSEITYSEMLESGIVLVQDRYNIYMLNYLSSADGINVQLANIYSQLEISYEAVRAAQEKITQAIKASADGVQLLRKDLELLIPSYKQVLYADYTNNQLELYCFQIQQPSITFRAAYNTLQQMLLHKTTKKPNLEQLFEQDLQNIAQDYPTQVLADFELLNLPELVMVLPSPPINQNHDQLDQMERNLYTNYLILNTHLTFDAGLDDTKVKRAQLEFDKHVIRYANECLNKGLLLRVMAASRLLRSRKALEAFRTVANSVNQTQLSEYLAELHQQNYMLMGDFQTDEQVLNLNVCQLLTAQPQQNLYFKRVEDMSMAFEADNEKDGFRQMRNEVYGQINEFIKGKEAAFQQLLRPRGGPVAMPRQASRAATSEQVKQEEPLMEARPDGNQRFREMLNKTQKKQAAPPETPKKQTIVVASSTTSPQKAGINLSKVLGKQ